MITELAKKIKAFFEANKKDLFLAALVFLIGLASFGLGRLSVLWPEKEPIVIENQESGIMNQENADATVTQQPRNSSFTIPNSAPAGRYVASKNGSSYHLPDCPGAKQIKEENKVWFSAAEEAQRAGYKPAGNCPGL